MRSILHRPPCGIVTDVDGTISEISASPDAARVPTTLKEHLRTLVKRLDLVAAISGRSVDDVRGMVGVDELVYVGNHGLEWWINGKARLRPGIKQYVTKMARTINEIESQVLMDGVILENKGATVAIHYRQAKEVELARAAIFSAVRNSPAAQELSITEGKMLIELRPPVCVDKGWALARLARDYRLSGVIYLGDDITDVDAFALLRKLRTTGKVSGLAIAVLGAETPRKLVEIADATLQGVPDVERFFQWIAQEVS